MKTEKKREVMNLSQATASLMLLNSLMKISVINMPRWIWSVCLILILSDCHHESPKPQGPGGPGVYFAGAYSGVGNSEMATYWKDNVGAAEFFTCESAAIGIAISDFDVYVVGGSCRSSFYWKNGVVTDIKPEGSVASSIHAYGKDVYITGAVPSGSNVLAAYWKNGVVVALGKDSDYSLAGCLAISGNDIYVGGYLLAPGNDPHKSFAVYWKNGNMVKLTDGSSHAIVGSIAVSGSDVYMSVQQDGIDKAAAKYWKNGRLVILTDSSSYSNASAVAVSGNDVYVAGTINGTKSGFGAVTCWKNGNIINSLTPSENLASVTGFVVSDSDVYVSANSRQLVGGDYTDVYYYWKNGTPTQLAQGGIGIYSGFANSLAVVK